MNSESSPKQEKSPEENMKEIADKVLVDIENALENHIDDPDGLLLSPDFSYEEIQKQLVAHAQPYGEALFRMARKTVGKERMRYADGFSHFLAIVEKAEKDVAEKVLESLLTNRETVKELQRKAREELEDSRDKPKNFFSGWWKND